MISRTSIDQELQNTKDQIVELNNFNIILNAVKEKYPNSSIGRNNDSYEFNSKFPSYDDKVFEFTYNSSGLTVSFYDVLSVDVNGSIIDVRVYSTPKNITLIKVKRNYDTHKYELQGTWFGSKIKSKNSFEKVCASKMLEYYDYIKDVLIGDCELVLDKLPERVKKLLVLQ